MVVWVPIVQGKRKAAKVAHRNMVHSIVRRAAFVDFEIIDLLRPDWSSTQDVDGKIREARSG